MNNIREAGHLQEYGLNPAAGAAAGWMRAEHNENLRRWAHWGFGTYAVIFAAELTKAVAVALAVPVLPAVAGVIGGVFAVGFLVTAGGALVNVTRGAFEKSKLNPNPNKRFFRRNA